MLVKLSVSGEVLQESEIDKSLVIMRSLSSSGDTGRGPHSSL